MKFLTEYRDASLVKQLLDQIAKTVTRPWTIMEVCGGQTHSLVKNGLLNMLPENVQMIHGPGCPVCVTPLNLIDKAIHLAEKSSVILCSFGDMLRVPGSKKSLLQIKAEGADVRILYSPLEAVELAIKNPEKEVIFFAVGFETTAPANALSVLLAYEKQVSNFSILTSHVLVPPAMEAVMNDPDSNIKAFLAAGHVCTIMGIDEYYPLVNKYKMPIVVTGFEPVDLLQGILMCVQRYFTKSLYLNTISISDLMQGIVEDLSSKMDKEFIAAKFHYSLVAIIRKVAEKEKVHRIAFSGGVFQNSLLVELITFHVKDFELYFHKELSPNDENISFGQLVYHHISTT